MIFATQTDSDKVTFLVALAEELQMDVEQAIEAGLSLHRVERFIFDNPISLRSLFPLSSAVGDEADGTGGEQSEAGGFWDGGRIIGDHELPQMNVDIC